MAFHRPGATVLLVENMPEMHASFTTSWWRRHARDLSEPARRSIEWVLLEIADIAFVLGVVHEALLSGTRALGHLVPYAAIAGAIIGVFTLLL